MTYGYEPRGQDHPPARDGTIITFHSGQRETLKALTPIVDWLNQQHLCSTDQIRADATGGVIPAAPSIPTGRNLVRNASLEARRLRNPASK